MTRDEILKMEAGSDMDALVAEKVMGVSVKTERRVIGYRQEFNGFGVINVPIYSEEEIFINHYSTDIKAAWDVVEKIAKEPIAFHLETENVGENKRQYWVLFFDGEDLEYSADADAAPLAICRAALLAVIE